jgi:hypothetical protein
MATTRPNTTRSNTLPITTSSNPSPTRTASAASSASASSASGSCNIGIPDYTVLRQQNLDKINNYYTTLLSSYTQSYRDFTTQSASSNVNDRTYANTTLKPKVENYNKQIINVSQSMINNVDQDTDLIMQQKDELLNKTRSIDTILNNINMLKDKDNEMTVLSNARRDSLNSTKSGTDDMNFNTYIYIGINILMVLCVVGIVIYIVYSSYSVSKNNNRSGNNVHRNIMVNKTS